MVTLSNHGRGDRTSAYAKAAADKLLVPSQTKKGLHITCGDIQTFSGRGGAINLEQLLPLAESIFENWNPESFDESLLVSVGENVEHESFYKY